jgi:hypothetical protein
MTSLAWLVANKDKFGDPMHSFSGSCPVCDRVWRRWVYPTHSSHVAPLVLYGHSFGLELAFRRQMHTVSQSILFSSLIQLTVSEPDGPSYSLSGLLVYGWCVMSETFEYSKIFREFRVSALGQSQDVHLSVVESLVLFGNWLIFVYFVVSGSFCKLW